MLRGTAGGEQPQGNDLAKVKEMVGTKQSMSRAIPDQWFPPDVYEGIPIGLGSKIFVLLDDPRSCKLSKIITWLMMSIIVTSCTCFVIASMPEFRGEGEAFSELPFFTTIELVCIIIFTVEYGLRMLTVAFDPKEVSVWDYFSAPMNLIDFLAIAPFYVNLLFAASLGNMSWLRILRVARVLRMFKVSKYTRGLQMMARTLQSSSNALYLLVFMLLLGVVLFGSLLFFAEVGEYDPIEKKWMRPDVIGIEKEESPFQSIPAALWCILVTFTTVGYGDMYPTTVGGKLIVAVAMLMGLLVLALPIGIIGSTFTREYNNEIELAKIEKANAAKLANGLSDVVEEEPTDPRKELEDIIKEIQRLCGKADNIIQSAMMNEAYQELYSTVKVDAAKADKKTVDPLSS